MSNQEKSASGGCDVSTSRINTNRFLEAPIYAMFYGGSMMPEMPFKPGDDNPIDDSRLTPRSQSVLPKGVHAYLDQDSGGEKYYFEVFRTRYFGDKPTGPFVSKSSLIVVDLALESEDYSDYKEFWGRIEEDGDISILPKSLEGDDWSPMMKAPDKERKDAAGSPLKDPAIQKTEEKKRLVPPRRRRASVGEGQVYIFCHGEQAQDAKTFVPAGLYVRLFAKKGEAALAAAPQMRLFDEGEKFGQPYKEPGEEVENYILTPDNEYEMLAEGRLRELVQPEAEMYFIGFYPLQSVLVLCSDVHAPSGKEGKCAELKRKTGKPLHHEDCMGLFGPDFREYLKSSLNLVMCRGEMLDLHPPASAVSELPDELRKFTSLYFYSRGGSRQGPWDIERDQPAGWDQLDDDTQRVLVATNEVIQEWYVEKEMRTPIASKSSDLDNLKKAIEIARDKVSKIGSEGMPGPDEATPRQLAICEGTRAVCSLTASTLDDFAKAAEASRTRSRADASVEARSGEEKQAAVRIDPHFNISRVRASLIQFLRVKKPAEQVQEQSVINVELSRWNSLVAVIEEFLMSDPFARMCAKEESLERLGSKS
ncbi:hypothetical protein [Streptomyces sp. NPDC055085]